VHVVPVVHVAKFVLVVVSVIVIVLAESDTSTSVVAVSVADDPAGNEVSLVARVIEVGGSDGGGSA
jgi:hypothetical protein